MSDLRFSCPICAQPISYEAAWAGLKIKCPKCQSEITVPTMQSASHASASSTPPPFTSSLPPVQTLPRKKKPSWVLRLVLILVVAFAGFMGFRVVQFVNYVRTHPRESVTGETAGAKAGKPGEVEFREANRKISINKDTVAFGNNAEAVALAATFSQSFKIMRDNFFSEGKKNAISIAKGEMLTHCQLNSTSCVFLVHVPELRRFTREAKDSLTELAWMNAQSVLAAKAKHAPTNLIVGVRGAILYESVTIGSFIAEPEPGKDGVRQRESGMHGVPLLYPYFAPVGEINR